MARLGEILVDMKACTAAQVAEGLANQVIFGGRLGTNLLEIGHVDEETLARALGRRHSMPCLHGDLRVDPAAVPLLGPKLVDRLEVVPYLVQDRKLALLVCDPNDLRALDEVAFATGKRVHPLVVPEARMWVLMRRLYGIDRQLRGIEVDAPRRPRAALAPAARPEANGPDLMAEDEFQALYQGRMDEARARAESASAPRGDEFEIVELTDEVGGAPPDGEREAALAALAREEGARAPPGPSFAPPPASPPAAEPAGPEASPLGFAEATRLLEGVGDRDAIARAVLRYARTRFRRALLLTVRRGAAHGWEGLGEGLDRLAVRRIRVRLGGPGVLSTVVESRAHFLGPFPKTDENLRFLKGLGGGVPRNAFVVPILALGRVVNLLYGDAGRGGTVDGADLGELLILAARIGTGYEALLARAQR